MSISFCNQSMKKIKPLLIRLMVEHSLVIIMFLHAFKGISLSMNAY